MTLRLAENIRKYRKERRITQEQLAEAMGVSVGAVSRWESGDTSPDISIVPELAQFFDTSTDVLLGYDLQNAGMQQSIAEIRKLRNAKHFDEATPLVERLLMRYANSFDAVLCAAQFYRVKGTEQRDTRSLPRSLELLNRLLELEPQNTNPRINRWTLRNELASVYQLLGQTDRALEELQKNNADGLNDGEIGMLLTSKKEQPEEALPYLSDALISLSNELMFVLSAYGIAYGQQKRYRQALDALECALSVGEGLMCDGKISFFNMYCAQLLSVCAIAAISMNDTALCEDYLRRAKHHALTFDAAPDYGYSNIRFFHSKEQPTAFTDFGATAMEGIEKQLCDEGASAALLEMWARIRRE